MMEFLKGTFERDGGKSISDVVQSSDFDQSKTGVFDSLTLFYRRIGWFFGDIEPRLQV